MRKIESEMVTAIVCKMNWCQGNTCVIQDAGGTRTRVYLHGNLIAVIDNLTKTVRLSSCNWKTPTTKSRLNVILKTLSCKSGVRQENSKWLFIRNSYGIEQKEQFKDNMVVSFR